MCLGFSNTCSLLLSDEGEYDVHCKDHIKTEVKNEECFSAAELSCHDVGHENVRYDETYIYYQIPENLSWAIWFQDKWGYMLDMLYTKSEIIIHRYSTIILFHTLTPKVCE